MSERNQFMPDMSEREYMQLKHSIEREGVLDPVVIDADTGEIVDGHHRKRVAEELGLEVPTEARAFASAVDRKVYAITVNLVRRHLGPVAWGQLFGELLEARGVQTGSENARKNTAATVAAVAEEQGMPERTARDRMELARELEPYPEIGRLVDENAKHRQQGITQKDALELVRNHKQTAQHLESGLLTAAQARESIGRSSRTTVTIPREEYKQLAEAAVSDQRLAVMTTNGSDGPEERPALDILAERGITVGPRPDGPTPGDRVHDAARELERLARELNVQPEEAARSFKSIPSALAMDLLLFRELQAWLTRFVAELEAIHTQQKGGSNGS